ncbi:type II toxin-antitoxin system HicA family toxin [Pantoea sp. FN0307]|uniref:type II toxin-antitoxin system HicA family toxin n=1 Tax=Pantoea sp. FN0307 TaxID=3418560 RepID=UPI003CF32D33
MLAVFCSRNLKPLFNDIMTEPPKAGVKWDDIISLIEAVGGVVKKSSGSRRKFQLGNTRKSVHC